MVIYADTTSTIVLTPGCCGGTGVYSMSVMVDTSLPIEFRTGSRQNARSECQGAQCGLPQVRAMLLMA